MSQDALASVPSPEAGVAGPSEALESVQWLTKGHYIVFMSQVGTVFASERLHQPTVRHIDVTSM